MSVMAMPRSVIVIAACICGVWLSGCVATNATPPAASAIDTAVPLATCPAAVPSAISVGAGDVRDGKSFGFVHYFDGIALYVDPAEFFGNEDAIKAAREDGEIGPGEDLPNPFYIRNRSTAIVRLPVSSSLKVKVIDNQTVMPRGLSLAAFTSLYCSGRPDWLYSDPTRLPTWITVDNGVATEIVEQYVP